MDLASATAYYTHLINLGWAVRDAEGADLAATAAAAALLAGDKPVVTPPA